MNNWFGKLLGSGIGLAFGGPWGAVLGAVLGHSVDQATGRFLGNDAGTIQQSFFTTVFSAMGHLAKADGRVSEREIAVAEQIIQRMQLHGDARRRAIEAFNVGKQPGFRLSQVIAEFREVSGANRHLHLVLLEILMESAFADGYMNPKTQQVLARICAGLGIRESEYVAIHNVFAQKINHASQKESAYTILGVSKNDDPAKIKKAYRRLMNQHHPDKLIAKGLPPEMIEVAKQRTAEIAAAYDSIRKQHGL